MGELECKMIDGHFVVNDGCHLELENSTVLENELCRNAHLNAIEGPRGVYRTKHLLYLNGVSANVILEIDSVDIRCPVCEKRYTITHDMLMSVASIGDITFN